MNDTTLGQYYSADSFYHRLDPRTKFISTLLFLSSIFLFQSLTAFIGALLYLILLKILSRIPLRVIIGTLKPILILVLFIIIFQMITVEGTVLWKLGFLQITQEGITKAFYKGFRLLILVMAASYLTFSTTPMELTDGLEKMLEPLTRWKVPVHDFALMILLAIKFIPILSEETDKLMKAQIARGVELDEGNMIERIKNLVPILIPLFISTFHRATELGTAMEVRGYRGGEYRTSMHTLQYRTSDKIYYIVFDLFLVILLVMDHFYGLHILYL